MNRTLTSLEEKGIIHRERSDDDKRNVYITLNQDHADIYEHQHARILNLVESILSKMGMDKADDVLNLFHLIADTAEEII